MTLRDLFVALLGERDGVGQHGLALVAALVRVLLVLEGREVDEDVEPRALHGSLERQRRNAEVAHDIRIGRADERCEQVDGFQTDLHHRQGDLRAVAEARLHRAAANGLLGVILLGQGEGFDEHVEHLAVAVHHVHEALLELVALGDGVENALTVVLKALFGECEAVDHHGQRDADAACQTRDRAAAGGGRVGADRVDELRDLHIRNFHGKSLLRGV